jgi:hypothetical protein
MPGGGLIERARAELRATSNWIAWVRLLAVPFVFFEVVVERGNYPAGYERWAWTVASVFALGALVLFLARASDVRVSAAAYVFDVAVISSYVVIYSFEPSSPVRQLLLLPVIEAALRWGRLGGVLSPLASAPALAVFEWKAADRLGVPYDPGHVIFPIGLQLLVGLMIGALRERAR